MAKIFSSTNNFSSLQTQGGGQVAAQHAGICAALTSLWCLHMLEGRRDLLTRPSYARAQSLQVLYRWDPAAGAQDKLNLLERIGVKGTVQFNASATSVALSQMSAKPGVYRLGNGAHSIGAAVVNNRYYFYDCDENGAGGLHAFDDADDWRALVTQHYGGDRLQGISTAL
ncbi:MAG TPA: hypothetical protein VGD46_12095 [Rhizobacter sp.]